MKIDRNANEEFGDAGLGAVDGARNRLSGFEQAPSGGDGRFIALKQGRRGLVVALLVERRRRGDPQPARASAFVLDYLAKHGGTFLPTLRPDDSRAMFGHIGGGNRLVRTGCNDRQRLPLSRSHYDPLTPPPRTRHTTT